MSELKYKVGDIIDLKKDTNVSKLFDHSIIGLEIKKFLNNNEIYVSDYTIWNQDKSDYWYVDECDILDYSQQVGEQTPSDSRVSGGATVQLGDSVVSDKPVGTFTWAVQQMKEGKKVRCKKLAKELYLCKEGYVITFKSIKDNSNTTFQGLDIDFIDATDWEIYENNIFGDFKVDEKGSISSINFKSYVCDPDEHDILEKAINRARELKQAFKEKNNE